MGPFNVMFHSLAFWVVVLPLAAGLVTKSLWSYFEDEIKAGVRFALAMVDVAVIGAAYYAASRWWPYWEWYEWLIIALIFFALGFGIIQLVLGLTRGAVSVATAFRTAIAALIAIVVLAAVLFGGFSFSGAAQNAVVIIIGVGLLVWVFGTLGKDMSKSFKKSGGGGHKAH